MNTSDINQIYVQAVVKFPHKTITIEGEIRSVNHTSKGLGEICLKIDRCEYPIFDYDKPIVVNFDENSIVMEEPFYCIEFGGFSDRVLTYTKDIEREFLERYPGMQGICLTCNHGFFESAKPETRHDLLTTYSYMLEVCEQCELVRDKEEFRVFEREKASRSAWMDDLFNDKKRDRHKEVIRRSAAKYLRDKFENSRDPGLVSLLVSLAGRNLHNKEAMIHTLTLLRMANPRLLQLDRHNILALLQALEDGGA